MPLPLTAADNSDASHSRQRWRVSAAGALRAKTLASIGRLSSERQLSHCVRACSRLQRAVGWRGNTLRVATQCVRARVQTRAATWRQLDRSSSQTMLSSQSACWTGGCCSLLCLLVPHFLLSCAGDCPNRSYSQYPRLLDSHSGSAGHYRIRRRICAHMEEGLSGDRVGLSLSLRAGLLCAVAVWSLFFLTLRVCAVPFSLSARVQSSGGQCGHQSEGSWLYAQCERAQVARSACVRQLRSRHACHGRERTFCDDEYVSGTSKCHLHRCALPCHCCTVQLTPIFLPALCFPCRWVTKNQTRGVCPSYAYDGSNNCQTDSDCTPLKYAMNGRQTGRPGSCRVNYTDPQQLWPVPQGGFCDVFAWCPTEFELTDPAVNNFHIVGVDQFTVFVRMNVNYPAFGITLDNARGANTTTNGANLWTLRDVVSGSGYPYESVQRDGMTVGLNAVWDCDFDKSLSDCAPQITFVRLDDPSSALSSGFNFRSIEYLHDRYGARQLTKHYGVRMLVLISGVGRKFDVAALFTAIGAGIGLLSVATLVAGQ